MTNARFTKSVIAAAAETTTQMPWARGKRRATFIAKRKTEATIRKTA